MGRVDAPNRPLETKWSRPLRRARFPVVRHQFAKTLRGHATTDATGPGGAR